MEKLRDLVDDVLGDALLQRVMPEAVRRIRAHRAAGHKTILITGTVDVFVRPLAGLFDEVVASRMHTRDGVLTGYLDSPPLVDEARAAWLRRHASDTGIDLEGSYAYADSYSDRPLLEAVGGDAVLRSTTRIPRDAANSRISAAKAGSVVALARSVSVAGLRGNSTIVISSPRA